MAAEGTSEVVQVMEILLTAEIFNQNRDLDESDLSPRCREAFGMSADGQVKRPVIVSDGTVAQATGIGDASEKVKGNPFIEIDSFGHRMHISALDAAAGWFLKKGGKPLITRNPALASFFEGFDSVGISYMEVKAANPRVGDTRAFLDAKIAGLVKGDEALKAALDLLIISAPDEVEPNLSDLICTGQQAGIPAKVRTAILHQEFLRSHRIYELGKLLFVGPPGTGKTTLALALSRELHMPLLEVRLSMVTSQYLGETSKNIDRIFEFAKKISPSILFIDEFDFVAKSRITDDHGAMKRAVNMLLKNIDRVSLVRDGVLLIAATNHPHSSTRRRGAGSTRWSSSSSRTRRCGRRSSRRSRAPSPGTGISRNSPRGPRVSRGQTSACSSRRPSSRPSCGRRTGSNSRTSSGGIPLS